MSRKGETTAEKPTASVSFNANVSDEPKRRKIMYIVYLIAALDVTWMFLQFSVTPVSISLVSVEETEFSAPAVKWTLRKLLRILSYISDVDYSSDR